MTVALPDTSRRAGEWIARYVSRVNPKGDNVDYLMVSHFHNDHTGDASNDVPMTSGRKQDYKLTGIMEVGEYLHFSKAFDRGYPDYSYPLPIEDEDVEHYRAFVAWKTRTDNLQSEKFEVGVLDQIKLLSGEYKYKDFHIRNLVSNGIVWMGEDADSLVACYDLNPEKKAISVSFSDLDAVHGDQARHTYTVSMTGANIPEGTVVKIMSDGLWSNVELLSNKDGKVIPYKVYGSLNTIEVTYDDIVNGI